MYRLGNTEIYHCQAATKAGVCLYGGTACNEVEKVDCKGPMFITEAKDEVVKLTKPGSSGNGGMPTMTAVRDWMDNHGGAVATGATSWKVTPKKPQFEYAFSGFKPGCPMRMTAS